MKETVASRSKRRVSSNDIIAIGNLAKLDKAKGNAIINGSIGVFLNEDGSLGKIGVACRALEDHIADKLGYPSSLGDSDYLDAVEHWVYEDHYDRIHELYHPFSGQTLGGTGAISIAYNLFLEEGEHVILPSFMWGNYTLLAEKARVSYVKYDLFDEKGHFNMGSLKARVSECLEKDGRALLIVNDPCQNPTGYCLSEEEYDSLFEILNEEGKKGRLAVLFDIAYLSYYAVPNSRCRLIDKLAEAKPNFLPLLAFSCSKVFSLYGLRIGALLGLASSSEEKQEIENGFAAQARGTYSCPVGSAAYALSLAMRDTASREEALKEIARNKEILRERGEILLSELDKAHIDHYPYHSGFFLTIRVNKDANEVFASLKAKHIYIVPLNERDMRIALSGLSKEECVTLVRELKGLL